MPDLTGILNCTYGASGFQLQSYRYQETPVVKEKLGRIGTKVRIDCSGYLEAADPGALADSVAALETACRRDGQAFQIATFGGNVEQAISPDVCTDGGPHCQLEISDGPAMSVKNIELTLDYEFGATPGSDHPAIGYKVTTETQPDGRQIITWDGEARGGNATGHAQEIISAFPSLYPWPDWITKSKLENSTDFGQTKCSFVLSAELCSSQLLSFEGPSPATAVDGEATVKIERDENYRLVTVYDFDFLITGDPVSWHGNLRSLVTYLINESGPGAGTIHRESFTTTQIKGVRVKSSFTFIDGGDSTALMEFQQTIRLERDVPIYEEKTFVGASPILIQKPATFGRITQTGYAVCADEYFTPPAAVMTALSALPEITDEYVDIDQRRVSWRYQGYAITPYSTGNATVTFTAAQLERPTANNTSTGTTPPGSAG